MLDLKRIQEVSVIRSERWHKGGLTDWSALEWAGAMAGEAGEACNAAKKLKRIEDSIQNINTGEGRSLTDKETACEMIGDELADTLLYAVLVAARVGVNLEDHVVKVFNKKSEEYGFPDRL